MGRRGKRGKGDGGGREGMMEMVVYGCSSVSVGYLA